MAKGQKTFLVNSSDTKKDMAKAFRNLCDIWIHMNDNWMFNTRQNAIWNLQSMVLSFIDLVVEDSKIACEKEEITYLHTETILRSLV